MSSGTVEAICVAPLAKMPMRYVHHAEAVAGRGLAGDRYATGEGSFSKKYGIGSRQVTLTSAHFFEDTGFEYHHSRRNIIVRDTEIYYLIGREFLIGTAILRGVRYCEPCNLPTRLRESQRSSVSRLFGRFFGRVPSFMDEFRDRGGIIAEVTMGGIIQEGDLLVPPPKSYKP